MVDSIWKRLDKFLIPFLLPCSIFLTFNIHSKQTYHDHNSVIWADAAGYYSYLPGLFLYGFQPEQYPENIQKRTGSGFITDHENGKVFTKYTYGVALLELPFFCIAHLFANTLEFNADGFSPIYYWAVMIAAVCYGMLGLFFLKEILKRSFGIPAAIITVFVLYLGTNLYYYTINSSGMSHVYSFFLFALLIYRLPDFYNKPGIRNFTIIGVVLALCVLIRPTAIVIILAVMGYGIISKNEIGSRFEFFRRNPGTIAVPAITALIIFLPQLLYWKFTLDSWFVYSYGQEGFDHWSSPKLLQVWFSTQNGLFTYSPLLLLCLPGFYLHKGSKQFHKLTIIAIFLLVSYLFASWWTWWFGCSYGGRSFVEYYVLLAFPLASITQKIRQATMPVKILSSLFVVGCIYLNMQIIYGYDDCWYGGIWDWSGYLELLK